jgi:hypothetical protein
MTMNGCSGDSSAREAATGRAGSMASEAGVRAPDEAGTTDRPDVRRKSDDGSGVDGGAACRPTSDAGPPNTSVTTHSTQTVLSVPPTVKNGGHENDPLVYAGYLDVTLYGAKGDGETDDTAAIQDAINDSASYSMITYVPFGTYVISKTLTGIQLFNGTNENVENQKLGTNTRYGGLLAPSLVGPGSGPRPTIQLKAGTFTDASSPVPMIHLVNTPNCAELYPTTHCGENEPPAFGDFAEMFNGVIRDINVTTGDNAGAIGIQFYSTQNSYIQNVSVDARGGYAGLEGDPATEVWVNIAVNGGQYGIMLDGGSNAAGVDSVAGLALENQTVAGVLIDFDGVSITGFSIDELATEATGVKYENGGTGSAVALIDGTIQTAAGLAAIDNEGNGSLYLNDVYLQAPTSLVVNAGSTSLPASGHLDFVTEYSHAASAGSGLSLACYIVVNDETQTTDYIPSASPIRTNVASAPSDFVIRHVPGQLPFAFDTGAFWVTDYGADPTGFTDSTKQIQSAIEAAHQNGSDEVFLPRGNYDLNATLQLYPNTRFFGIPGAYSALTGWGFVTGNKAQPLLQVGNADAGLAASKAGRAIVTDLTIALPAETTSWAPWAKLLPDDGADYDPMDQTYLYAIDWQVGQSSVLNQVIVYERAESNVTSPATRNIIQVEKSGGGRWYGLQSAGGSDNSTEGHVLDVAGTSQPLSIYGSNLEHSSGSALYAFTGAENIRVFGTKTEDRVCPYWFELSGCSNVLLSDLITEEPGTLGVSQSSNITINDVSIYGTAYLVSDAGAKMPYIEDDSGKFYSVADAYALFKISNVNTTGFDNRVFPHCGDLICDGGETAENCAQDCACP